MQVVSRVSRAPTFEMPTEPQLDDGEVLRTPYDRNTNGIPREGQSRARNEPPKRAILWNNHAVRDTGAVPEMWGKLPVGFLDWAYELLQVGALRNVLHVCSGGLGPETNGVRVDIRPEVRPDVVADGRALPFADDSFDAVLLDPPYSVEYARDLYRTDYPRPSALLREAARVVKSCHRVGILHFLVPRPEPGLRLCEIRGVTQGCGYRIRAFTIFQKEQRGLFA